VTDATLENKRPTYTSPEKHREKYNQEKLYIVISVMLENEPGKEAGT
jgi:hypothetical protein